MRLIPLFVLALPVSALAAPSISISSSCPSAGPATVNVTGLTPGGQFALAHASKFGTFLIPGGACAGTAVDLGPGPSLIGMYTANGSGNYTLNVPSLPAGACNAVLVALDMSTCEPAEGTMVRSRDLNVAFPRSTSTVYKSGSGLGTIASGFYLWTAGEYIEDTYASGGVNSITGIALTLPVEDYTNTLCGYYPWYSYDVNINGAYKTTIRVPRGNNYGMTSFYTAGGFAATAPVGGNYTIRVTATDTICGGGGSYRYLDGGRTWLAR